MTTVVAVVPAKNRSASVGQTVTALADLADVDRVLVVDDGSSDATADVALAAGADVLSLPVNRGKGGAVAAAVAATPDADVYLLIDADLAATAVLAGALLSPVLDGSADMTVAVFPPAGKTGGFGLVRDLAARGIRRATAFAPRAPLSGQRAVRAQLLRHLPSAERFGLEVALTIDAVRSGARVVEIDLPMDHCHTGRGPSGFAHRARQGSDAVRSLWPRLTTFGQRATFLVVATAVALAAMVWWAGKAEPESVAATRNAERVVIFGIPHLGLDDLDSGLLPNLDRLVAQGALASASVRTSSSRPSATEAYATLGAGTRVAATVETGQAYQADAELEGGTAAAVLARRTGRQASGEVVVVGGPATVASAGDNLSSAPGALGQALQSAGLRTAVIGNSDTVQGNGLRVVNRPAAVALMDGNASVDAGSVGQEMTEAAPEWPYGLRGAPDALVGEVERVLDQAQVIVIDPGDTLRAAAYAVVQTDDAALAARQRALRATDEVLGLVAGMLGDDDLLLVVGMTPPTREWELTPMVAWGAGVVEGYLHSPSTRRLGLVTITDVAPTILAALGQPEEEGMIGAPLRYHAGEVDLAGLMVQNDRAGARERAYLPMTITFIVLQAVTYLFAILVLSRRGQGGGARPGWVTVLLRTLVLAFAAWPLATFVLRAVPGGYRLGAGAFHVAVLTVSILVAWSALHSRRHPLSPLAWICGLTVALLVVDLSTGATLQMSSVLGYSPHTAARFTGVGNTAFAVLAATTVVAAASHVQFAERRREAVLLAGALFLVVLVADGAPGLGADVGGILTMVPVFGLTLYAMSGRRLSWKVAGLTLGATLAAVALATVVDLAGAPEGQSHLGQFATDVGTDRSTFLTTLIRKWETNVRVFRSTIWTWMVPITAAFMIYVLVVARGWQNLLPARSPLRAGVVGVLAAGVLGWLVNDSGVVVTALVFVYVGPYLTMLALADDREPTFATNPARQPHDLLGASTATADRS